MSAPRLHFGRCRTGKTYALKRAVVANLRAGNGWAFLVADLNGEWPGEPGRGLRLGHDYARVRTVDGARRALAAGARLVIVSVDAAGEDAYRDRACELAAVAIAGPPTVLVLPEAHLVASSRRPLPAEIATLALRYRHPTVRAGLWLDCQHPADLHRSIQDEAREVLIFGLAGQRDFDRLRELCASARDAEELVAASREAARRAAAGDPGWHVRLDPSHVAPPFELRK